MAIARTLSIVKEGPSIYADPASIGWLTTGATISSSSKNTTNLSSVPASLVVISANIWVPLVLNWTLTIGVPVVCCVPAYALAKSSPVRPVSLSI